MRLGIVRDDRYLEHKTGPIHPESPRRLRAVYRMLDKESFKDIMYIKPRMATLEDLELVHTPSYIDRVLSTAEHKMSSLAPDTPTSSSSYLAAVLAVGGCLEALDRVVAGECDMCLALIRPPGHHALPGRAGGFCIFNNLAVCARYAINKHSFERILIVDWDIHHGNGINDIFYEDKSVLYFSTHDPGLYPFTGDWKDSGEGEGKGYTINMPVGRKLNDIQLYSLYSFVLRRIMDNFSPQALLFAMGFDSHQDDPIGRGPLKGEFFIWISRLIVEIKKAHPGLPILFSLEGGYEPELLRDCTRNVISVLTESRFPELPQERDDVLGFLDKLGEIPVLRQDK